MSENAVTQYLRRRLDLLRGELREVQAAIEHQSQCEKAAEQMRPAIKVDVLAAVDAGVEELRQYDHWDAETVVIADDLESARAAMAELIAERDALRWALREYPKRNPHQLQARKVCEGVVALVRIGGE